MNYINLKTLIIISVTKNNYTLYGTTIKKNCLVLDAKKYLPLTCISGPDYF